MTLRLTLPLAGLLATASLGFASLASAAGSVEYEVSAEQQRMRMAIEWLDERRVRMDMQMPVSNDKGQRANLQAWQLLRDGKIYSVTVQNGKPVVMELSGMLKMMGSMVKSQAGARTGPNDVQEVHSLKPTGRRETVAGVSGEVYLLDYQPEQGERRQEEVVLSGNATVREMTLAMMQYGRTLALAMGQPEPEGSRELQRQFGDRQLGLLRFGSQLKATRISGQAPAASRMELPAKPMAMPDLGGLAGLAGLAGGARSTSKEEPSEGAVEREANRQVERQKDRVSQRAQAESEAAVDRGVDKAIEKALGKLFGR